MVLANPTYETYLTHTQGGNNSVAHLRRSYESV